ncbi:MAG: hypothetical protein GKR91_12015 [Pseudomonadales bacterium]|nr:hypothetical protein [Pseudomonadales bacterium]
METSEKTSCPKCGGDLESKGLNIEEDSFAFEQCSGCYGLLIPAGVTRKLKANWGPDTNIDTGSETIGKKYDKVDDIQCLKCNTPMDKIEDPEQPHIWYESCPSCGSSFYDAGELKDLNEKSFTDLLKRFTKGTRK